MAEVLNDWANVIGRGRGRVTGEKVEESKDELNEPARSKDALIDVVPDDKVKNNLPQDMPFSSPEEQSITLNKIRTNEVPSTQRMAPEGSPMGGCCAANAHAWVSPNRSDEISSSRESPADTISEKTPLRENKSATEELESKDSISINLTPETEYEAVFEPAATMEAPSISIVDKHLEVPIQKNESSKSNTATFPLFDFADISDQELHLDVSSKDWIKIVHGGKEVMIVLPTEVCCS